MKNIKIYIIAIIALGCFTAQAQESYVAPTPSDGNYVLKRTYQQPRKETDPLQYKSDVIEGIQYFDGIGRPQQSLGIGQSPSGQDIVTPYQYDDYGRMLKEWLPYVAPDDAVRGNIELGSILATQQYYLTNYNADFPNTASPTEVNAYSEKMVEASPRNRVLKQAAPGKDWAMGTDNTDHTIGFSYGSNTHDPSNPTDNTKDNVRLFTVDFTANNTEAPVLSNDGYYLENELTKVVTSDENHSTGKDHTTEEFTDKLGRVVLKRTYNNADAHDTYYVYDDFGNLTYVLPPLVNTAATIDQTVLEDLCYQYVYDHHNRLVEKQLPGKKREYIVYNNLDQPILTQDANQRGSQEWLFTQYDVYGRVAYTGKATIAGTRPSVQSTITALPDSHELWTSRTADMATTNTIGGKVVHYNTNGYPDVGDITEVLTVNYYDDYVFDKGNEPTLPSSVYGVGLEDRTKGLATGSLIKVLTTNDWITAVTRYDDKARPIYTYSENSFLGTEDVVISKLDFVGRPITVRSAHTRNATTIVTIDNFEYDHVGRMLRQTQCIGDQTLGNSCVGGTAVANVLLENETVSSTQVATASITIKPLSTISGNGVVLHIDPALGGSGASEELIAHNDYDELGQLVAKKVGGAPNITYAGTTGLQTVNYGYNVRGWLKSVNNGAATGGDLWGIKIAYNDPTNFGGNENPTALFNGNISQVQWKSASANTSGNPISERYSLGYDALERLTSAIDNTSNYDLSLVEYDKNGNIQKLKRNGHRDVNATNFGLMDDLTYSYTGNQLKAVDDATAASGTTGFVDGSEQSTEYIYNANGNLLSDTNKGISAIEYNHLNLPTKVTINGNGNNGIIEYVYDANGDRIRKQTNESVNVTSIEYSGNYVYENGKLQFFNNPEGYASPINADDYSQGFGYIFQYKDHLGNIRFSYTENNGNLEIVEENNYYPFGLKHKGYNDNVSPLGNSTAQKWKYNGKELEESLGYDMVEMDMRQFDPAIARWVVVDPIVHHNTSPYAGFDNNPIFWTDPSGGEVELINGAVRFTGADAKDAFRIIQNNLSSNSGDGEEENNEASSNLVPFTSHRLFQLGAAAGADKKQSGLAFESAALEFFGLAPNTTKKFQSKNRKALSGIGSVIPDAVTDISVYSLFGSTKLPNSSFHEVKAITGTITLKSGSSDYQVLGLIEAVAKSTPGGRRRAAILTFYTTANTLISPEVISYANKLSVKVKQSIALEDRTTGKIFFSPTFTLNPKFQKLPKRRGGRAHVDVPVFPNLNKEGVRLKF